MRTSRNLGSRRGPAQRFRPRLERLESREVPFNPVVLDPNLAVRTVVSGLVTPSSFAFIGPNDFFILEQVTGKVKHVVNGAVVGTPIDLAVNNASERGLLGIALHPNFSSNGFVYLYWTESSTGQDSGNLSQTPLLGNRVDRFVWNGSTLTFDRALIQLHAFQADANQPLRGNHNGGKITFGPDGKLYIFIGDNGRRGQMQNLPDGPWAGGNQPDDQFGGPEPDSAHATGVIYRLNDDGSAPLDNPFFRAGELRGGEVGATLKKIYSFGSRNGFGQAFDPISGFLWEAENGDDSFSEINRVEPGSNFGWVEFMGPVSRVSQFKAIETSPLVDPITNSVYFGLQQLRWSPTNIADTPREALDRLFHVVEGGDSFAAALVGAQELPPVTTAGAASLAVELRSDGTLHYTLKTKTDLTGVTLVQLQLGARNQKGPPVATLFTNATGASFAAGAIIADGVLRDSDIAELFGFEGTATSLAERMRQGRVYVNLSTLANPGGEIRGELAVTGTQVSHYVDPEMSWKYEVAPVGLGFLSSSGLGQQYQGNMFVGEARVFLDGGFLFRLELTQDRKHFTFRDARLLDRVADNNHKFDITESETLLFGVNFGIATDIQTGPNGNLFVVSLSDGAVYEIFRPGAAPIEFRTDAGRTAVSPKASSADFVLVTDAVAAAPMEISRRQSEPPEVTAEKFPAPDDRQHASMNAVRKNLDSPRPAARPSANHRILLDPGEIGIDDPAWLDAAQ